MQITFPEIVALINQFKPDLVMNIALPYQDLTIMDACLETGVHYLDTANYEPKDEAKFEYSWQWAYQETFQRKRHHGVVRLWFRSGSIANLCSARS
jgi:saccharopine dehydrogenase (NAD+, L-lysine-forming)